MALIDKLTAIADGFRTSRRTEQQYTLDEMAVLAAEALSGMPVEISTEEEMTALLETAEVGSIYKYIGESTDMYENGGLYLVEVTA